MKVSKKIEEISSGEGFIHIKTDAALFRILFLKDDIVRIRSTFEKEFKKEASYTLVMTAWEDKMDQLFKGERKRVEAVVPDYEDLGDYISLKTSKLQLKINKEPFGIEIYDNVGNLLHADLREKSYVEDKLGRIYHYSCIDDSNYFYGFGEKTGLINKAKRRMRMHNVDTIGYDSEYTDPLYKHIPFYIKLDGKTKGACGYFYHNSHDSVFDMGCERSGYWNKYSYFCADGGEIDLLFMNGPEISTVVKNYTDLTGKSAMQPMYSLGYMGSTMYYTELDEKSDEAILGFIDRTKEEEIPCDGFFMSSGYTTGENGKRYVFNWNYTRFPSPEDFIKKMNEKGASVAPNVKPGMLLTHPLYNEFMEAGAYIKDSEGKGPHHDRYWGGKASFVDFTNPKGRETWKNYMKKQLVELGITSIWNDNCEYEINDPEAICEFEGEKAPISALNPIMANIMAFVAKEAVEEVYPNTRPYITNRAGFAGIQRYAQTWAGDNNTSWKSLKFNIPVILGMGLSGVANQGCDIGGFFGPAPDAELFVRWVQNGIFQPRFSIHSCNTDNTVTEPWMYPSYAKYIKEAIQFRYNLAPYFYSLLKEAAEEGTPIMRPLFYEFQQDEKTYEESFDFMFGKSILVASIFEKGAKTRKVYLPKGSVWRDWYTGEIYEGGQTVEVEVTLDRIPIFCRSGAIIPMTDGIMNLHKEKIEKLNILIEPWEDSKFTLYEDDGITYNYLKGEYCKTKISVKNEGTVSIDFSKEGNYESLVKDICLDLSCRDRAPIYVRIDDRRLPMYLDPKQWNSSNEGWYYDNENKTARIKYKNMKCNYSLKVNFDVKDLISI